MRVLITGSSGQIGTNLGLRLVGDGHAVFGVDKRQNPWTDAFPTLLQDLAGHYPAFEGGIGGVEYPPTDLVVHLAAHAKVHQLVREPHRALENAIKTINVLEYAPGHGPVS
jgi:nucleoside-diphosphate-sugar epimerase